MPVSRLYRPETLHGSLGESFFDEVEPAAFPRHVLRFRDQRWAQRIGLETLDDEEWIAHFGKFEPLPDSFARPLALRYHGHQFRTYNPDLGDGRGFLFAQVRDHEDGRLLDLGTKGSGQTPWSRRGDGRLTLKGGVREILATQMLEAMGVDTSKSLSLIETGEQLIRGDEPSPTRSSVLVRLSHSHIRIGTFQRLAYLEDKAAIERLLDHSIAHYFPEIAGETPGRRAASFLEKVTERVARLAASYMAAGFVHGVLNSDNINITGESFDYGPWRFAPTWDTRFTAAYFDESGLYAFGRQAGAIGWNLARLAECLLPMTGLAAAQSAIDAYPDLSRRAFHEMLLRRLGLVSQGPDRDANLASAFVKFLIASQAPLEQAVFDWRGGLASSSRARRSPAAPHYETTDFQPVREALDGFEPCATARLDHPYFSRERPCSMLIDEVETIWTAISERDDWGLFYSKLGQISEMRAACKAE
ncbi:protein adenylyltransferase SelO [Methylocystis heyeri]|uniref:Protein nucleotidyltransferase YdiU n=1 Tax=Methylocystis heyeri TaxID=391905 RepID=A0A6B8KB84_9HYPH|nr:YdiU family protein [Methylocystis heyeri]QGM44251.1 YdiU family protein [Methylocystis heyeri]